MTDTERASLHETTSDFVTTRCRICAAGATINTLQGSARTFCLMLREWMTDTQGKGLISACDRFEERAFDKA